MFNMRTILHYNSVLSERKSYEDVNKICLKNNLHLKQLILTIINLINEQKAVYSLSSKKQPDDKPAVLTILSNGRRVPADVWWKLPDPKQIVQKRPFRGIAPIQASCFRPPASWL